MITHCRLILGGFARPCRLYSVATTQATPSTATEQPNKGGLAISAGPPASLDDGRSVSPQVSKLVDEIASLSLLDAADLNRLLKKKLKIPDAMPMMRMAAGAVAAAPKDAKSKKDKETKSADSKKPEEEVKKKSTFNLKLTAFDPAKKVDLIKEMRKLMPNMNLVQAKKFIESAPVDVKTDISQAEADKLKEELAKFGATCVVA